MIIVGLVGMASKFVECALGVTYRNVLPPGVIYGESLDDLRRGLAERGFPALGKFLAAAFAIMMGALGGGNMFQGNQAHAMMMKTLGLPNGFGWVAALGLAAFVCSVIVGGMPSISSVTSKWVPVMAVMYVGMFVIVFVKNPKQVGSGFAAILNGAVSAEGVAGGFVGTLIQGLKRATFFNESGVGSAAIAHSAVKTDEPVTQGLGSLLEPFVDTVVICTMTALVITIAGLNGGPLPNPDGLTEVNLTAASFQAAFDWFRYLLALVVLTFAISMMNPWSYCGLKGWTDLFGEGHANELIYKVLFCVFIVISCSIGFSAVIDYSDAAIFAMGIFNIIGLYFLMPVVKKELNQFLAKVESAEFKRYRSEAVSKGPSRKLARALFCCRLLGLRLLRTTEFVPVVNQIAF